MEWSWLRDWWRLKKYRCEQRRRKIKHLSHLNHVDGCSGIPSSINNNTDEENQSSFSQNFLNQHHPYHHNCENNNNSCSDFDEDDIEKFISDDDELLHKRIRRHRRRLRLKRLTTIESVTNENNNDNDIDNSCKISNQVKGEVNSKIHNNNNKNDVDDDVDFNYNDIDDDDDDNDNDGDEVDDFCYCDECLNGDTDFCESNDGMDSDASTSSNPGKQVVVGICAMAKKTQSKPMKEILTRLQEFEFIKMLIFEEDVILKEPVENWPICDCLVSFHSKGFPLEKAIQYAQLRKPYVLNNLHMQYDIQDRRRVYAILQKEGIEIPRYAVLDRDSPDPKQHELIESEDHVEVNGIIFNKPFVEKPVSAEDHNIYIYYPTSAGGGSQRLFRKIGSRSSVYSPESRVRKTGSFIYEDFMPTDVYFPGTDVKVYTVGPDYAHAEARKSPALDGKVERDSEGKEIRYPVILNHAEKLISRKVCLAFKQTVCGFDLLRANGKSYVCDVNGFSFVKNSNKYYDDCAKILGNMILRELTPTLHIPWSVPFQLDDPPIVPTTFGKMMELRCVVAVIRHGDRTPKQKMKVEVRHPKFFEIFEKYDGFKHGHVKLKRPKQLQEILDIARFLLAEIETKDNAEIEEKKSKLEQLKSVLEMYGHFSGINRKVQMKYQPKGRPRGSSSDDDAPTEPSLVLILKWGGELTPAGRIQAEELGRIFRCMYPGGQGRQDYSGTQGLGLLRLHSTFRHDLKIYASDEGRVQMTAAAFAKGLLALEGELTPILVQMVKSANTNGLLDNDCDSSKYQNMAKTRLHELMRVDREFTAEDRMAINPNNSISINQALDFVKNPVECCNHVHNLIKELLIIISIKKDDIKTKDAILYHGETWDLMRCRWEKIEKDFSTKSKQYDISKIPDIYDCIKYDLQHNQHTLQYDQAEELYTYAKYLADIVIPQEYGLTMQEKLTIGQGICTPLLKKIKSDLQRNIEEVEDESVNRLNPQYSHGVASPGRHVRTRLYFTSESHVHSLLTVLRYGGLLNVLTDEQWRRAMDYISMVSELNYMSQIVIMLYEDPTKDPTSEERFHVELHFSPGVNCCVQKNLPPGPGFRPHSRNDSGQLRSSLQNYDDSNNNPSRIDEENDTDESLNKIHALSPDGFNCEIRPVKSKPIPIGSHHTVSGHEAMDLAKRLNHELATQQQQTKQTGSLEATRPLSPDGEIRSRSFEQKSKNVKDIEVDTTDITYKDKEFKEILTSRVTNLNRSVFQIRVTDSLTLFKIDSSTNELPLSEIDFSLNPGTPEGQVACTAHQKSTSPGERLQKRQAQLLTMRRMESGDEPDFVQKLRDFRKISPLATNERPLSCNCSYHLSSVNENEVAYPHSHSKSEADISDILSYATSGKVSSPPINTVDLSQRNSFEEEYQLSSSAPAALLSGEFLINFNKSNDGLKPSLVSNSPTASTLQLCHALDDRPRSTALTTTSLTINSNNEHACNISRSSRQTKSLKQCLPSAQSAPVIVDIVNPFKFPTLYSFKQFAPIAENAATNTTFLPPHSISSDTPSMTMTSSDQIKLDTCTDHSSIDSQTIPIQHFNAYHHPYYNPNPYPLHHFHMHGDQSFHHSLPHHLRHHHNNNNNNHLNIHTPTTPAHIPNVIVTYDETSATSLNNLSSNSVVVTPSFSSSPNNTVTLRSYNKSSIDTTITTTTNTVDKPVTTLSSSIIKPIADNTTTDSTVTSTSSSSSVSSRRQRHSIAGQMSYMKMLGFGGFSKKMTTSASSLFSTAVISGSSSAPNLRDMIPVSSSVLDGFGGVPPIRPLETLHNALSLKQLDQFLEKMTSAPLFKTPTSTPPKNPSTPLSMMTTTATSDEEPYTATTPTNHVCNFSDISILNEKRHTDNGDRCNKCGQLLTSISETTIVSEVETNAMSIPPVRAVAGGEEPPPPLWSKQSSVASSITEPSSPAVSDTCSQETPSCDISISLTSTDGYSVPPTAAQRLAKFFPRLDDDLNSVSVYAPVNLDGLEGTEAELNYTGGAIGGLAEGGYDAKSACLTPVSFNMDLSIVANKGSLTLSVDGFEDDDDATPSAATTPSLPQDEPQLEFCYCCEAHSTQGQPPDDTQKSNELFNIMRDKRLAANEPKQLCYCRDNPPLSANLLNTEAPTTPVVNVRKASDTISPRIQKQISLFESGDLERQKEFSAIHASINIPQPNSLQLKQDARLRKFENLTQSTSNSNFPFESNTLKRVPNNVEDFIDVNITQSCINLKSSAGVGVSNTSSACSSPQHKNVSVFRPTTQSCSTMPPEEIDTTTSGPASPRPGALIVKEKFIEPPKRITRSFHGKTQSMDSDMMFNEFLLVPSHSMATQNSSNSDTGSAATSPSSRSNKRFTTTKVLDEDLEYVDEH